MKSIRVTCAIIVYGGKTLVVQRSETMKMPLKWEFPGGKIEQGESAEECILREIKEELNLEIELVSNLSPSKHSYPNFDIELVPFIAKYLSGEIQLAEHKQYLWLHQEQLIELNWAAADVPILKEYLAIYC